MSDDRPNIIVINVDQWRADCLGFAGHPVVETPHLDQLFEQGVNFAQAYVAVPSCIAARASLMTGLTQRSHGRVGYRDGVPWNYETTLPGLLAQAGYHTQGIGKMHFHPARSLMGFHNIVLHDGYLHHERRNAQDLHLVDDYLPWLRREHGPCADYIDTGIGCNGYVVRPWIYDDMLHPSAWVTTQAVDFFRRRDPRKPFFLFASYHRPHPPLDPPAAYLEMYEQKALPELPMGDWCRALERRSSALDSPHPTDPAQRDRARRAYYAQITFIDHQINRLIHTLWTHGCLENTCILFCADHGEMLYDHGLLNKGKPYDSSARVPFMIRFPRSWGCLSGATVDAPVALRDVLPTLCDIAGVPIPDSIEGKSLVPFCRGETPAWRAYIHGEHALGGLSNHWLTDARSKYVWYSQTGVEQLFNLAEDPKELHNLADSHPEQVQDWRGRLIRELGDREEGYVQGDQLVVGRSPQSVLAEAGLEV
jgi:arylsulfatase